MKEQGTVLLLCMNFWLALILGTLRGGASYLLPKCLITQIKLLELGSGLAREEGVCISAEQKNTPV